MRMVADADLVLTAEVAHRSFVLDDRPEVFRRLFTLGQLDRTLDAVPDGLSGRDLLTAAGRSLAPAEVTDDVHDPYRRGAAAAERADGHLDALLGRPIPRLTQG